MDRVLVGVVDFLSVIIAPKTQMIAEIFFLVEMREQTRKMAKILLIV